MAQKQLRICMVGFGHAAIAFLRLLMEKKDELDREYGYEILITAIAGRSKGNLIDDQGIDLEALLKRYQLSGQIQMVATDPKHNSPALLSTLDIIAGAKADSLLELSSLSIMDGQPAISHIQKAFERGLHVITANKGPIAWDYQRLKALAESRGLFFLHETTVMDGTPIFNLVSETLHGCKILSFKGILNSTTNFILTEMETGSSFDDAVTEAQRRGFAEADPSMDVDGWDAAAKTSAIANVILKSALKPTDIERTGIRSVSAEDINKAKGDGKKIKLICEAFIKDDKIIGRVHPVLIPNTELYSTIDATSSILSITTDLMGEVSIIEKNPEIAQTAYGIYSDLLTLIKKLRK